MSSQLQEEEEETQNSSGVQTEWMWVFRLCRQQLLHFNLFTVTANCLCVCVRLSSLLQNFKIHSCCYSLITTSRLCDALTAVSPLQVTSGWRVQSYVTTRWDAESKAAFSRRRNQNHEGDEQKLHILIHYAQTSTPEMKL